MSLYSGTFSLTRYRVLGRNRRFTIACLNQNLHGYQARPVSLTSTARELSSGWVIPHNPEHEDLELNPKRWDISDCLYENGLLLRLRIERRSVSASLLQEMFRQRLPSLEAEQQSEEPQRLRKKQLLDELKEELLALSLPTINFVDAFWLDQDDCIYVFSQSKMALQCFEELFHHSFGAPLKISLFRMTPPLLGQSLEAWQSPKADWVERLRRTLPSKSRTEAEIGTQSI